MTARTKKGKGQADTPAPVLPETDIAPGAEAAPGEGSTAAAVPSPGPEAEGASDTTAREARGSVPADSLGDAPPAGFNLFRAIVDQAIDGRMAAPPAGEAPADPAGGSHPAEGDSSGPAAIAESGGEAPKAAGDEAPPADTDDAGQLAGVVTTRETTREEFAGALVDLIRSADGDRAKLVQSFEQLKVAAGGVMHIGVDMSRDGDVSAVGYSQPILRCAFEDGIDDPAGAVGGVALHVTPTISIWRGGRHFSAGSTAVLEPVDVTREQLARILAEPTFTCIFVDAAADA